MRIEEIHHLIEEKQKEYDKMGKTPLIIDIEMKSPLSSLENIHFDAILGYFSLNSILKDDFSLYTGNSDPIFSPPIPIKTSSIYGIEFFCCSDLFLSENTETITRWRKRWDEENDDLVNFGKNKPHVTHKSGHFKAFDMPLIIKNPKKILCYANGNKEEIHELLRDCSFLGKKRSQGYGEIRKITIEESKEDKSIFLEKDIPARPIPITPEFFLKLSSNSLEKKIKYTAYKPPYWRIENKTYCLY